uniref:Uncharacterized protein n=1 Tax=Aegilops tauschii subsp. strangulata TaxID=200361 RepID=A0A452Y4Q4_AEGTS
WYTSQTIMNNASSSTLCDSSWSFYPNFAQSSTPSISFTQVFFELYISHFRNVFLLLIISLLPTDMNEESTLLKILTHVVSGFYNTLYVVQRWPHACSC